MKYNHLFWYEGSVGTFVRCKYVNFYVFLVFCRQHEWNDETTCDKCTVYMDLNVIVTLHADELWAGKVSLVILK